VADCYRPFAIALSLAGGFGGGCQTRMVFRTKERHG